MTEQGLSESYLVTQIDGDLTRPVLPGMIIARLETAEKPVSDEEGDTPDSGQGPGTSARELKLSTQEGCELIEEDHAVQATVYGLAEIRNGRVKVTPLLKVAPDHMEVVATLYPEDSLGNPITLEVICRVMDTLGIRVEPDNDAIESAIAAAGPDGEPVKDVVLAAGTPPKHGRNERVELAVNTAQSAGTIMEDGSIDFYEQGAVCSVSEGQLLGRLFPLEKGINGRNVYGDTLPADEGVSTDFRIGENVDTTEDKLQFHSRINGMVKFVHNCLSITEIFEISSDVDFNTGNIHMEKGSVSIQGMVRSGFVVSSAGNIVVSEVIEDAVVDAGGDVMVQSGILMHGKGSVRAEGSVIAQFAQNARIEAYGDVVINNNITNCDITAGGKVLSTQGMGRIQGGIVRCIDGIEANVVGSPSNTPTRIIVGSEYKDQEDLTAEKRDLKEQIHWITREIGVADISEILENIPPQKREAVTKILVKLSAARQRIAEIEGILEEREQQTKESFGKQIKIKETLYPGVVVTMAGCNLKIDHPITSCTLYYDRDTDSIRWVIL